MHGWTELNRVLCLVQHDRNVDRWTYLEGDWVSLVRVFADWSKPPAWSPEDGILISSDLTEMLDEFPPALSLDVQMTY